MLVKKIVELVLVAVTTIVMTGCGGSGSNTAIDKLISYATTGEPVPTEQDYADAGVVGVTGDNVASVNDFILGLLKEQVDTKEEVQTLADEAGVTLAPRAVIVVSRKFAPKGGSIRFDGSSSVDLDGSIVSYVWSTGGQTLSTEVTFFTTSLPYGTHIITLTVTDEDGNVRMATVQVRIEDAPEPPAAAETPVPPAAAETPVPPAAAETPVVDTNDSNVTDVNEPPIANAGPDQNITVGFMLQDRMVAYNVVATPTPTSPPSNTVTLDGSGSSDDGKPQPLTYLWEGVNKTINFSDATSVSPTFNLSCSDGYGYPTSITIKLTVSDGEFSATDTVIINTNYNCPK